MVEINVEINDTDPQTWNEIVNKSRPDIYNIYQTYEWAILQKRGNGLTPIFIRVEDDSGPCGGQLYFQKRSFGVLPAYDSLGGPLCTNGSIPEITEHIIDHLHSNEWSSLYTKVRTGIFPEINGQFVQRGFIRWPVSFFLIDLSGTQEDLWNRQKRTVRANVKRAAKRGLSVEEAKTWDQWLEFYKVYAEHTHRKGISSMDLAFFRQLYEQFLPKGMAKLLVALHEGSVIAGSVLLCYDKVVSDHILSSDERYESYYPNDLLLWNALSWGNRNGFSTFDFDDTWPDPASPYHGIHRYKEKWGGQLVQKDIYYQGRLYICGRYLAQKKTTLSNKLLSR